jgi:hypothetical protein
MKQLTLRLLGPLLGLCLMVAAAAPAAADQSASVRTNAARAFAGIVLALEAQADFNVARSRSDREEMRDAAADLLLGLAAATFWLAVLDADVDGSTHSEGIDADVRTLYEVVGGAFDRVDDLLYAGDLDGLAAALDESADTLTGMQSSARGVLDALFPMQK